MSRPRAGALAGSLALLALLAAPRLSDAQARSGGRQPARPGVSSIAKTIPEWRRFDHAEEIRMGYHARSDHGTVELRRMPLATEPALTLTAMFRFRGERLTAPPTDVSLGLTAAGSATRFARTRTLTLVVDGVPLPIGEMFHVADSASGEPRETLALRVPTATVLRLANARRAEGRLGTVRFTLTDEQLEALRDFASRMRPETHARLLAGAGAEVRAGEIAYRKEYYEAAEVDRPAQLEVFAAPRLPDLPPGSYEPRLVIYSFQVDSTGRVDAATLQGRFPEEDAHFLEELRRAAAKWRFTPALANGHPVRQLVNQTTHSMHFEPRDSGSAP